MSQVMNAEPEDVSGDYSQFEEARRFPAIGTREHTALVEAIKLNFPEIYMNADGAGNGEQAGKPAGRSLRLDFEAIG
jgi:hypothetical protein